jgi:hypothetical protein
MARNINKRVPVKWVRDRAKKAYEKKDHCYICSTAENLELHHLHSLTRLLETWAAANNHDISTDEGVLAIRDEFIEAHQSEIYDQVYTLCYAHHSALHGVYGKAPMPGSEIKQERWIELQKTKVESGETSMIPKTSSGSFFSEFC